VAVYAKDPEGGSQELFVRSCDRIAKFYESAESSRHKKGDEWMNIKKRIALLGGFEGGNIGPYVFDILITPS